MKMQQETLSEARIDKIFSALRNQVQRNSATVKEIFCIVTCFFLSTCHQK